MQTLPADYKQSGFTLIEVMIAMALLAFISVLVYQATVHSFDINKKLTSEAGDLMGLAVALQTLEEDCAQIYTPLFPEPATPLQVTGDQSPKLFWSVPVRTDGIRRARFLGTSEKMSFITNSNVRVQRGVAQSDFLAVAWEVAQNKSGTYQLKRFTDTNVFNYDKLQTDDKDQFFVIIDNLSSAQFSYYRKEGDKWEESWDSEGQSVKPGARYPELISIKLEGPDPTNPAKQMQWRGVFRPNIKINTATETKQTNALPPQ